MRGRVLTVMLLWCGTWGALGLGPASRSWAAPPWQKLVVFRRVEADPSKTYALTEDVGPWCILAKTFSGDGAVEQANQLVLELRQKFKLNAYTHQMNFDFSGEVEGKGIDQFGEPKKMKYRRSMEYDEIGVIIGDFQSVDDPEAQKVLQRLRYIEPDSLTLSPEKKISSPLAGLRWMQKMVMSEDNPQRAMGPMAHAFITTNPLLPREYFVPKGPDRLVLEMNKGVEHSLLRCGGKYTLKVATFTGQVIIDQQKIREFENGRELESRLADAADKAHRLTLALRQRGFDAYEFHDRYASLVTVGSFDTVGTPRKDGKTEINPEIHQLMEKFRAEPSQRGDAPGTIRARSFGGVACDPQPTIVEVPQSMVSASYERFEILGRR